MNKQIIDIEDNDRIVRVAPHRFGQRGNLIVVESEHARLDLHLTDAELRAIVVDGAYRLGIDTRLPNGFPA